MRDQLAPVALLIALGSAAPAAGQRSPELEAAQQVRVQEALEKYQMGQVRELEAKLERRPDGKAVILAEEDPTVPIGVANEEDIAPWLQAVPLEVKVVREEDELTIQQLDLKATDQWKKTPYWNEEKWQKVNRSHEEIEEAFERARKPDATQADQRVLRERIDDATVALGEAYAEVEGEEDKAALRKQYRELRRTGKAIYGSNRDDRYPPSAYQEIYENSRGGVALARKNAFEPHCSGFLVGNDLVLTNDHCVRNDRPSELEVRFNYEQDLQRRPLDEVRIPVRAVLARRPDNGDLDFALLELGATDDNRSAGEIFQPLCVSTMRVRRDDPVYVVGHPNGLPRTVHDNAFVYFPFQVTEPEMQLLTLHVEAEFEQAEDAPDRIAEFRTSYQKKEIEGTTVYENYSALWDGQPTIGVDSDTFHGNSGSPVFHRRNHMVVGILFDGQEDLTTPFEIGWRAHEAALPVSEVVEELDAILPEWRNRSGICVDGT